MLVRVPSSKKPGDARIELRSPDPTANPYLALAACLKAGLKGIKDNETLPPSIDVNIYNLSDKEREALGVKSLPISLNERLKLQESPNLSANCLVINSRQAILKLRKKNTENIVVP